MTLLLNYVLIKANNVNISSWSPLLVLICFNSVVISWHIFNFTLCVVYCVFSSTAKNPDDQNSFKAIVHKQMVNVTIDTTTYVQSMVSSNNVVRSPCSREINSVRYFKWSCRDRERDGSECLFLCVWEVLSKLLEWTHRSLVCHGKRKLLELSSGAFPPSPRGGKGSASAAFLYVLPLRLSECLGDNGHVVNEEAAVEAAKTWVSTREWTH